MVSLELLLPENVSFSIANYNNSLVHKARTIKIGYFTQFNTFFFFFTF